MPDDSKRKKQATLKHGSKADRLLRMATSGAMSVDLVSAFAGDRDLTQAEKSRIEEKIKTKGAGFYSELFYTISHQYFAPEIAEAMWNQVLRHKHLMSESLRRNVRITVATLDYLSNITSEIASPTLISEANVEEMANLSMRDGMTGLYNHSSCYELLDLEFRSRRRYGAGVSLIMLDIDDFKMINDRHGHQEGDCILIALADTIIKQTRESDICCRFGGEEFVVILPLTCVAEEACEIAERIRESATFVSCEERSITISAGVALSDSDTHTPWALIESADRALYQAKRGGKNRIVLGTIVER